MPSVDTLLNDAQWRRAWRGLLFFMLLAVAWLAFTSNPPRNPLVQSDKINHLLAFSSLAVAAAFAVAPGARRLALAALGLLAYGGMIEIVQSQLPYRSGEWLDLLADAVGIALGLALATALRLRHPPCV